MKILVLSCDKNDDIFYAFHYCIEKYWKDHPEIIYATETKQNPYYKTISKNEPLEKWTKRIRETLAEIDDDKILLINDDCFIAEPVNQERMKYLEENLTGNIAEINMETSWDSKDLDTNIIGVKKRQRGSAYELSLLCGLWQKDKLIKILEKDSNCWQVEYAQDTKGFDFYINDKESAINWGSKPFLPTGLVKGKWTRSIVPFFEKEGIEMDYTKRGFVDEKEMILSIITPYYNALEYTKKLAQVLEPQLNDQVEWIIVDDGCNEKELDNLKAKVIHLEKNSGGASLPRNVALDNAKGKFITFIDADDLVKPDYVEQILYKISQEDFDYCYIGWESPAFHILITDEPPAWNLCIWNCIYKRSTIANERFNENIVIGEDYDFNVRVRKGKKANLPRFLYYYNDTPNSLMKRGTNGNSN